ncbi:MAG: carboxypeptidase regulatory-like domain-containing protein [Candidatus Acidiferrales bacterium]
MRPIREFPFYVVVLAVIAIFPHTTWSQTNASLRGTVTDQSGGIIVGAKVTLTNTGTGIARTTTSGSDGSYLFDLVQVGTYKVTVEKSGFATFVEAGIVLELNQNGRLDVSLKVGQGSQTIEVTGNVAQVDTTSAVLGKVEDQRMINDLPLLNRDTLQLGLLQAGVFTPDPDDGSGNPFSVSGQRSESLTFLLDGGNNTDFLGNNIVVNPNPDAVEEFKILTNNYDAQYGRTSGGIVNQVTRSGTNEFHGDLFEFNRNNLFNAKDYFLPSVVPKESFKRNVFGATTGGPIKKDKMFFFAAYQGWRSREGQTSPILTVLSPAERTGNFREVCGSYDSSGNCTDPNGEQLVNPYTLANIPYNNLAAPGQGGTGAGGSLVNPIMQNYINKYVPLPNLPSNGYVASPTAAIDNDQGILHFDFNLSSRDALSFVYVINDERDNYPFQIINGASTGGDLPIGSGFTDSNRTQIGSFTWTRTLNPGMINEFRFAANRYATLQGVPTTTTSPAALGFTNVNPDDPRGTAPPIMYASSFTTGPSPQGPTKLHRATFEWADNFTWTRGKHEWKFGADFTRIRENFNYDFYNNGSFDFDNYGVTWTNDPLADFVGGFWDNYYQFSNAIYGIRTGSMGFYGQDTWKVLPRLSLNLGLRYEYYVPQYDHYNEILGFFPGHQSTVFPNAPPDILYPHDPGTPNRALVYPDKNNFAPRFGFAWDMFGNAKLVMRGGFGIFYDIEDGALNLQFGAEPPFGAVSNIFPTSFASGVDPIGDPFNATGYTNPFPFASRGLVGTFEVPAMPYIYTTYPHFRTPYSENFNYGFQWQATKDMMLETVYVGSLGRKLISSGETNFPSVTNEEYQLATYLPAYNAGLISSPINPECARPLAACTGGFLNPSDPLDPSGLPTGIQQLFTNFSNGLSDSDQLQVTLDKRFSHGLTFRAAYTWSKTIDLTSGFRARSSTYTDPYDHRLDRAIADFDVPQRFVFSGVWELPIARNTNNEVLGKIAKGWQLNAITTFQAGQPFTVYANSNASQQDNYLDRPDIIGPVPYTHQPRNPNQTFTSQCNGTSSGTETGNFWFNPTNLVCNACPYDDPTCSVAGDGPGIPLFTYGNMPRNYLRGPGINDWDLSIVKKTNFRETKSVEFRAEFFNAFNHVQFLRVDNTGYLSPTFAQVISDRGPRLIQFGLKLYF